MRSKLFAAFVAVCCIHLNANAQQIEHAPATPPNQQSPHQSQSEQSSSSVLYLDSSNLTIDSSKALLTVQGAVLSALPYIKDDNPAGYTQTYLRFNFERPCIMDRRRRLPKHDCEKHFAFCRNFFAQIFFSTNAENLPIYFNYGNNPKDSVKYVNRLDLVEHSKYSFVFLDNILTYSNFNKPSDDWQTKIYLQAMGTFMRTVAADTTVASKTYNVTSILLGGNLTVIFTNNYNFTQRPLFLEVTGQTFWVNAFNNSLDPDLNFQYENRGDYLTQLNNNKKLIANPYPFYLLKFLARINLNKTDSSVHPNKTSDIAGSYLFLSLAYTSNFAANRSGNFYNNYFQAQVGLSIDIGKALNSLSGNKSTPTPPTAPTTPTTPTAPTTPTPPTAPTTPTTPTAPTTPTTPTTPARH